MIYGGDWLFIDNPKTASTSIRKVLQPHAIRPAPQGYRGALHTVPQIDYHAVRSSGIDIMCVVRNPYSRMVRAYEMRRYHHGQSFEEWLYGDPYLIANKTIDLIRTPQHYWTRWATNLLRYEAIADELPRWGQAHGMRLDLLHLNAPVNRLHADWRDYYTPRAARIVRQRFMCDFEMYEYDPDEI